MASFQRQRFTDRLAELLAPWGDPGDLDRALWRIVEAAVTLFAPDLCAILAINPVSRQPMPPLRHHGPLVSGMPAIAAPPRADGITRLVLDAGIVFVEDIAQHPEYQSPFVQAEQIRAFAAVTITGRVRGQPLAVLYLDFRQPHSFDAHVRTSVHEFADFAALLLQQTWLLHRYGEVARIGKEINHELSTVEELFEQLHKLTGQILDVSHLLMLGVYQPERDTLDLHIVEDGVARYQRDDSLDGFSAYVLRLQRTLLVRHLSVEQADLPVPPVAVAGTSLSEESAIFVPLQIRDRALGILSIQSLQPWTYDGEDARVLELLANHVALAIGNIRLFDRLTQVNEIGRLLTDRFDANRTLENITGSIRQALKADLVLLYRYDGSRFAPAERSGHLLQPDHQQDAEYHKYDVALMALRHPGPVFARDSAALYTMLGGEVAERPGAFERREQVRSTAALPLMVGKEHLGVLFVNYRQPQRFDVIQRQAIESVASYAAVALRTSRLFADQRERQLLELQILREIDQALGATLDLQPTLQIILDRAIEYVGAYFGAIYLYDPLHNWLETGAFACPTEPDFQARVRVRVDAPDGLVGFAFTHRRPVRVGDVLSDPFWSKHYRTVSPKVRSEIDVPLIDGVDVVGVINLESTRLDAFSQRNEEFLVTLAGQAVLAIKKAQAYEREKRLADERAALIHISREMIARIEPEAVFGRILELALQITDAQSGTLMLYDLQRDYLHMAASVGVHPDYQGQGFSTSAGITGMVARQRRLVNVPDVTVPPWTEIHLSFIPNVRSELAVPMLEGERLRGVINVESVTPNHFTDRDERLLTAFADQALIAIQHTRMYERFRILDETGRALAPIADPAQMAQAYQIVIKNVIRAQPDCQVAIWRFDAARDELRMVACRPEHPLKPPPVLRVHDGGPDVQVARERRASTIADTLEQSPGHGSRPYSPAVRSIICTPLLFGSPEIGTYYGNLTVLMEAPNQVLEIDRLLLEGLAQSLALTLQRLEITRARQEAETRLVENDMLALVGQFAWEVLHELGNEVRPSKVAANSIRRELEALGVSSPLIEQELRALLEYREQASQMLRILNEDPHEAQELLRKTYSPRKIDVAGILRHAVTSYPYSLDQIEVLIESPPSGAHIFAREQQVRDILRNLFTNAVQVQPAGGRIVLRALLVPPAVMIEVEDSGPGIAEEDLQRIFEPRYTTRAGGTGFGLFSARRYARMNNGDLEVRSRVGAGSTFVLTLPLHQPRGARGGT